MTRSIARRTLALLWVAALATACASNAKSGNNGSKTGSGPIVIGASMSLSGPIVLNTIRDGYQYAVDQVNAAGGLEVGGKKRKVELKILDNRTDTSTMVQQVRSLILTDKAVGLLGSCCQQNIAMQGQADALKTPLVMGALPVDLLPKGKGYAWDSFQALVDGAKGFYALAAQQPTNRKVVVVTGNDAPGLGTAQMWSGMGKSAGFQIVVRKAVPNGTVDFSDVIAAARGKSAQILVAAMAPPDCFAMWKQMKALKYAPKLAIGIQCAQTPGWSSLGALGNGTLLQMNWTDTSGLPQAKQIVSKFGSKYSNANDLASVALGIHEATILMNAISKAGSTTADAINRALATGSFNSALGPATFKDNHSTTPTFIGQWEDGKIKQVWPKVDGLTISPLSGLG